MRFQQAVSGKANAKLICVMSEARQKRKHKTRDGYTHTITEKVTQSACKNRYPRAKQTEIKQSQKTNCNASIKLEAIK